MIVDIQSKVPKEIEKNCKITTEQFMGRNIFIITPKNKEKTNIKILYFHGGSYVAEATRKHWKFIEQLANDTGATVILPDYPLTPKYTYKDVFKMVVPLYKEIIEKVDTKVAELKKALPQLTNGANRLKQGSEELAKGMNQFQKEGIEPICNLVNGTVKNMETRVRKLGELSLEYNNYTMLKNGEEGKVQFIMLADGVKKESRKEEQGQEIMVPENRKEKEEN